MACRHRKKDIAEYCLGCGPSTAIYDDCGLNALHNALGTTDCDGSCPRRSDLLQCLLDYGVDPSAPDETIQKLTPLHRAATNRDFESVKTLLEQEGTDINALDADEVTPLWHACTRQSVDANVLNIIKHLVDKGGTFGSSSRPKGLSGKVTEVLKGIK